MNIIAGCACISKRPPKLQETKERPSGDTKISTRQLSHNRNLGFHFPLITHKNKHQILKCRILRTNHIRKYDFKKNISAFFSQVFFYKYCEKRPRSSLCTQVPCLAVKKWTRSIIIERNIFCKCIIPIIRKEYALLLLTTILMKNGEKRSYFCA